MPLENQTTHDATQRLRNKERLLAIVLTMMGLTAIALYLKFLQNLGPVFLGALIVAEIATIGIVYFALVRHLRRRG